MAGDWIKMRGNLWDDPRVSALVDATDSSEAAVVGGLYWLWATADQHTEDGTMPGLTVRQIDRKTGLPGFGQALVSIGWLADHPEGVRIVNFEEHNGASAKKRCQTAKRVAKHESTNAPLTQAALAKEQEAVRDALAREELEKEKEKKKKEEGEAPRKRATPPARPDDVAEQVWADWLQHRKTKRAPVTETVLIEARAEAGKAGLSLERFLIVWCARGSQGLLADWLKPDERGTGPAQRPFQNKFSAAAAGVFGAPQQHSEVIDV